MTNDPNGWPGKPGVPLNPEKTGWHWLSGVLERPAAFEWLAHKQAWLFHRAQPEDQAMAPPAFGSWTYLGPALTPAEVDARVSEARREALEEAAQWHDQQASEAQKLSDMKVSALDSKVWGDYAINHREYAAAIRALKGEGDE